MYCPSFPEAPTMQTRTSSSLLLAARRLLGLSRLLRLLRVRSRRLAARGRSQSLLSSRHRSHPFRCRGFHRGAALPSIPLAEPGVRARLLQAPADETDLVPKSTELLG